MAQKKSASSKAAEPNAMMKALEPAAAEKSKSTTKAANKGVFPTADNALGNQQIGEAAGVVWSYLTDREMTSLAKLKKDLSLSSDLLLAAVGWLAREDKLEFVVHGKSVKISLRF